MDFRFHAPLAAARYRFMRYADGTLQAWPVPRKGARIHLPREDFLATLAREALRPGVSSRR